MQGEYSGDGDDRGGSERSVGTEQPGDLFSRYDDFPPWRNSSLGVATVAQGGSRVVELLGETEPKFPISGAIDGRWDNSGESQGSADVEQPENGRNDASDSRSRGNDHSPRGDSLLGAIIVVRGDLSATESSAENELKVATLSAIDGRKGERSGLGAAGASSNSS